MQSALFLPARAGEPQAVADVVEALSPRLRSLAAHYARRTGLDAEDLYQEALCGVLLALPTLDVTIGTPRHFLIRHARWRLLDFVRRHRRLAALPADAALVAAPDTTAEADAALDVAAVRAAAAPPQRAILDCLLAGMSWRATAAALGCTHANVAYHLTRIREQFACSA